MSFCQKCGLSGYSSDALYNVFRHFFEIILYFYCPALSISRIQGSLVIGPIFEWLYTLTNQALYFRSLALFVRKALAFICHSNLTGIGKE